MTIFGCDMSHFDAPDIGSAIAEGIVFLTHKAGGDRDDPELGAAQDVAAAEPDANVEAMVTSLWDSIAGVTADDRGI